jgi:DNA repair exonuclease SbcCD ATPase subunit
MPEKEKSKQELESKLQLTKNKEIEIKNEAQIVSEEYQEIARNSKILVVDRQEKEKEIAKLKANEVGTRCDKCKGEILEENINEYIDKLQKDINDINVKLQKLVASGKEVQEMAENVKKKQDKIKEYISNFTKQISAIDQDLIVWRKELVEASKVREPKTDNEEALLQQKIQQFKDQIFEKKKELEGESPFKEIMENDEEELKKATNAVAEKETEVKSLEAELPYYDYWITGFGDNGIRKWIVDGIIPELNNRINYWLQFLIDNKITLKFDNELNEKIERNPPDGDPYIYFAMSTGQRRRLNLAVSQAFAHIMSISSGSVPSILFLDEISTNVDPVGNIGIYNMICELSEDRQVFVTTHDADLLRMLQTTDVLNLVHENGFTKLVV